MLSGLRVVELASVLAGPSVGMFLAELGAEVIKVENFRQKGDVTRSWKLVSEPHESDRSAYFSSVNWGKLSIGVDLKTARGRNLVHELVATADIVLASYKPGDAEKLEMDALTLRRLNPRLIYADLSAYGQDDPRPGYDAVIQAEAGFTLLNGEPEAKPAKMPVAITDILAAHQLKEGILLALLNRYRTGAGMVVRTSLVGAGLAALTNQATNWLVAGKVPTRMGSGHPNIVPYGTIYPTRDGKAIVLAVGTDRQFAGLCECLGDKDLAMRAEFRENQERVTHREQLNARLEELFLAHERDPLLAALHRAKVPAGALHDMAEVFAQDWAQGMVLHGDGIKGVRSVALEGLGAVEMREPPGLGADTDAVLRLLLGMSAEEVRQLRAEGAVG